MQSDVERIQDVKRTVEDVIARNGGVKGRIGDAFRNAFEAMVERCLLYHEHRAQHREALRRLAEEQLRRGLLVDPDAWRDGRQPIRFSIQGLCSRKLAKRLEKFDSNDPRFLALQPDAVAAALEALLEENDHLKWARANTKGRDAEAQHDQDRLTTFKEHAKNRNLVRFHFELVLARPEDWREPIHPLSLDVDYLKALNSEDKRLTVLYWLGLLNDLDAITPVVDHDNARDGAPTDIGSHARAQLLNVLSSDVGAPTELAQRLPADIAEKFLRELLGVESEIKSGEATPTTGGSEAPTTSPANDFWPAHCFVEATEFGQTDSFLKANDLRRAVIRGTLKHSKMLDKHRWQHSITEVKRTWPQFAHLIEAHEAKLRNPATSS